jgi:hypothetical protein
VDDVLQDPEDRVAPYTWTWDTTQVADGVRKLTIKAYDNTGNVTSMDRNVRVDNTAPTVEFANLEPGAYVKPGFVVRITPVDAVGIVKADYYVGTSKLFTSTVAPYTWALPSTLTAGEKTLRVVVTDAAGRTGEATVTFTVDTAAPTISSIIFSQTAQPYSGTVDITVTADDNGQVDRVDFYIGTVKQTTVTGNPATWSWDTTKVTDGSKTLKIIVYDAAGNSVIRSMTVTVNN